VMNEGMPLVIEAASKDPRWTPASYSVDVGPLVALPLDGDEGPIGAIAVLGEPDANPFTEEDVALLRLVGANMSTAVRLFRANRSREVSERLTSIGQLLSQVIHDFKTPMTVISGYAQLMADADDRATRHEYSELILKQFDVLTAMQREVLEFARGESTIFVRRVFVHKFLKQILEQLELEVQGTSIEVSVQCDPKLVGRLDEGRVARAIHNLARNAIEAMGEGGGKLTIRAELHGGELVISVSDTGPGIPKAIEDRLFQSFVTLGKTGGTGLGLAIVKKIVEEHGGHVAVKSTEAGASFQLHFPQGSRPFLTESERPPEPSA
jgi:signal transduction histidine kinase